MGAGVQLDDDDGGGFSQLKPVTAKNVIVKTGIVKNASHANLLLLVLVLLMIGGVVYFMKIALPPAPSELGNDIPARGEVIPANRTL